MIYIRIELWPMGDCLSPRLLQEGIIANVGGDQTTGEYAFKFSKVGGFKCPREGLCAFGPKNVLRQGEVKDFPRLRLYAQDLLLRALRVAFGDRNP